MIPLPDLLAKTTRDGILVCTMNKIDGAPKIRRRRVKFRSLQGIQLLGCCLITKAIYNKGKDDIYSINYGLYVRGLWRSGGVLLFKKPKFSYYSP